MTKVRVHTSASIFARRGDPWVTDKEGARDYGRRVDTETPDLDAFWLAGKAPAYHQTRSGIHPDLVPKEIPRGKAAPKAGQSITQTPGRRFAAAGDRLRKALARLEVEKVK